MGGERWAAVQTRRTPARDAACATQYRRGGRPVARTRTGYGPYGHEGRQRGLETLDLQAALAAFVAERLRARVYAPALLRRLYAVATLMG